MSVLDGSVKLFRREHDNQHTDVGLRFSINMARLNDSLVLVRICRDARHNIPSRLGVNRSSVKTFHLKASQ